MGDHDRSRGFGYLFIPLNHFMYPGYLSRAINIMSSILSTSFESIFPAYTIWSNSGDENGSHSGKISQLSIIEIANLDSYFMSKLEALKKLDGFVNLSRGLSFLVPRTRDSLN